MLEHKISGGTQKRPTKFPAGIKSERQTFLQNATNSTSHKAQYKHVSYEVPPVTNILG